MSKGFVTKGSSEYFAERETRIQAHIDEAKAQIETIEARVKGEIAEIGAERDRLRRHLEGFLNARDALVAHREKTVGLIAELQAIVAVVDTQLPSLDDMLDTLESGYVQADQQLDAAESSRHRQLRKHERSKTKYELRKTRLDLRRRLSGVADAEPAASAPEASER